MIVLSFLDFLNAIIAYDFKYFNKLVVYYGGGTERIELSSLRPQPSVFPLDYRPHVELTDTGVEPISED